MENKDLGQFLKELAYLVNIDSGSLYPEGVSQLAAFFTKEFANIGWAVEFRELDSSIGPCLEIINRHTDVYDILLLGHFDTVFPRGTAERRPFTINGNRAYGPGVADMKSGLLLGYYALKEMNIANLSVCLAINSEEEAGSKHTRKWLEGLAQRSRRVFVLEPARANGALVIGRKGLGRYSLEFNGRSAHAGIDPEKGASAIGELGHWIVALHNLTDFDAGTTVNVGLISGGTAANVIADKAFAEVNFRFARPVDFSVIEDTVSSLAKTAKVPGVCVKVRGGVTRPPMIPSTKTKEICNIVEAVGASLGVQVEWAYTGGGSDGSFAAALGIPTIDGLGPVGGNTHSSDEYIEIDSIVQRCELLRRSILQVGGLILKGE